MDAQTKMQIGQRVRALRESRGYTREQLGELSSLSPRFIANVEAGDSSISVDTLRILCQILSCSSDSILFGDEIDSKAWEGEIAMMTSIPVSYKSVISNLLKCAVEIITKTDLQKDLEQ